MSKIEKKDKSERKGNYKAKCLSFTLLSFIDTFNKQQNRQGGQRTWEPMPTKFSAILGSMQKNSGWPKNQSLSHVTEPQYPALASTCRLSVRGCLCRSECKYRCSKGGKHSLMYTYNQPQVTKHR